MFTTKSLQNEPVFIYNLRLPAPQFAFNSKHAIKSNRLREFGAKYKVRNNHIIKNWETIIYILIFLGRKKIFPGIQKYKI